MKEPKDYLVREFQNKDFLLLLKTGEEVIASVQHDLPDEPLSFFSVYGGWDSDIYGVDDVQEVLREMDEETNYNCSSCDGGLDVKEILLKIHTCDNCAIAKIELLKYSTQQRGVYCYNSINELNSLYKNLNQPIINNHDMIWDDRDSIKMDTEKLEHQFGLIYTWSHWDDFQDNPSEFCAIIDGAKF